MAGTLESDRLEINGRRLYSDGTNIGFLNTGGGWTMYNDNSGNIYSGAYGWLHGYFFSNTSNCITVYNNGTTQISVNCYGSGNIHNYSSLELIDNGGNIYSRVIGTYSNCNCDCTTF